VHFGGRGCELAFVEAATAMCDAAGGVETPATASAGTPAIKTARMVLIALCVMCTPNSSGVCVGLTEIISHYAQIHKAILFNILIYKV
jgi:hypothetical protein